MPVSFISDVLGAEDTKINRTCCLKLIYAVLPELRLHNPLHIFFSIIVEISEAGEINDM